MYYIYFIIIVFVLIYTKHKLKSVNSNKLESFHSNKLHTAVIVEPRLHKYLVPVIKNVINHLPHETIIQIFHGTNNLKFINQHLTNYIRSGKIILTNLKVSNLNIKSYNKLLTSRTFWNSIPGENILIFQTDSCFCSNSKFNIDKYLEYDYVGAPWASNLKWSKNLRGGNGGFSFRKKSKMIRVLPLNPIESNEDIYFSKQKLNYPSKEISNTFAVETMFYDKPLGIHKPWEYIHSDQLMRLKQNCPEISTIFKK